MHADKRRSSPALGGRRARLKLMNVLAKEHLLGRSRLYARKAVGMQLVAAGSLEYSVNDLSVG